ncbi:exoenzymes regulatory protein AepA precursor [Halarchaeum acidiphilum MH1-52-1]|uniref:Exoenzymes regulatory protein AepA n=1 Tax=Halarchaeum acidiphilum MH1-52-1 TaxID=1261545 RepID=U2YTX1_9EURY|nr:amidohydrolase family protein [Halarchaeum acidiphilum]GAD52197.1 exoenzymes regulatory protein AepA precursor [Halarchaeum acidiphilum MH1-52-1]
MHADADVVFVGGEVYTLGEPDETYDAVAVRDGRIVRLDSDYEIEFSVGVETDVIDLDGRTVLPGFVDSAATLADDDGAEATRASLRAAAERANERGVTAVHDAVVRPDVAGAYRDLAADGALSLRVALVHGHAALDALETLGARTDHGSERVRTGALSVPAVDETGDDGDAITPAVRRDVCRRADDAGLRIAARATRPDAIRGLLDDYGGVTADPGASRHRVIDVREVTSAVASRLADLGVVAVTADGDAAATLLNAGARVAFGGGGDGGVFDPLAAVNAAVEDGVSTTAALRTATAGGAYAGGDEGRFGTLATGRAADFVALDRSPWDADSIADVDVAMTVVGGDVAYDAR